MNECICGRWAGASKRCRAHRRLRVYLDPRDWRIGVYIGPVNVYVCPLPTLVIHWRW